MINYLKQKSFILGVIITIALFGGVVFFMWNQSQPIVSQNSEAILNLNEVFKHNKVSDCQVVVSNGVYDLTDWISRHPGGQEAIISLCGTDGTTVFARQHGSNREAQKALASYKIGMIKK